MSVLKTAIFPFVMLLAVAPVAQAQGSKHVVEVTTVFETEGVAPGATIKAAAIARISPGYHINDHKPSEEYLIPTEWKLEGTEKISVAKMAYPKGELKKFAFSEDGLSVYEGGLTIGALIKVSRAAKPGAYTLKGNLTYQACNDHACLPPKTLPVALEVKVVPPGKAAKRLNAEVFRDVRFD